MPLKNDKKVLKAKAQQDHFFSAVNFTEASVNFFQQPRSNAPEAL